MAGSALRSASGVEDEDRLLGRQYPQPFPAGAERTFATTAAPRYQARDLANSGGWN
jgi:hypothetical protein